LGVLGELDFDFVVAVGFLSEFVFEVVEFDFKVLCDSGDGVAAGVLGVAPFVLVEVCVDGHFLFAAFDVPIVGLLFLQIQELLVDSFQEAFGRVFEFQKLVIDEHQGIEIGEFELGPFELYSSAFGGVLADDHLLYFSDGGVPRFLEVRG